MTLAPDLPELEPVEVEPDADELVLDGALLDRAGEAAIVPRGIRLRESKLRGVRVGSPRIHGLDLVDVVLGDCELANVEARGGLLRRVVVERSRLVGLGLGEGDLSDVVIRDCSLELSSFAGAKLRSVRFESVNLSESTFMDARFELVEFVDCRLTGADFRGAKIKSAAIHGCSLDGVLGVDSLRGVRMRWDDVLASAGALAVALGITIETEP